ncbi:pyrroline-5-carboxylate reductase 3-like [Bacillus rossius redtenbacheri]|uniref:pyrroline-5-carboxylate reductase 3-like n=1 Tax=Bacillus rossius redtenbacheri TaxID=93214 RepID=UPI002FDDA4D9
MEVGGDKRKENNLQNVNRIQKVIGFIGAGNMAKAIGEGLIKSGAVDASQIYISAPTQRNIGTWMELGAHTSDNNGFVVKNADVIILAMKPQYLDAALAETSDSLGDWLPNTKLFISVLGGIRIDTLEEKLKKIVIRPRVIRAMPNTPMMVQEGCSAFCRSISATDEDVKITHQIFSAGGRCEMIPESLMNAVSAVSGSGPAFIFVMMEALADGAVKMGIPRASSIELVAQTVLGSAKMVLESGQHPGQLKDSVCSPGGSSICGINVLERAGVRGVLMDAIEATVKRSEEMGKLS